MSRKEKNNHLFIIKCVADIKETKEKVIDQKKMVRWCSYRIKRAKERIKKNKKGR